MIEDELEIFLKEKVMPHLSPDDGYEFMLILLRYTRAIVEKRPELKLEDFSKIC